MIRPVDKFGVYLEFRCQMCLATFDHALAVVNEKAPADPAGDGNLRRCSILSIQLQCPRCREKTIYKLKILGQQP